MAEKFDSLTAAFEAFAPSGDEYADIEKLKGLVEQWQKQPPERRKATIQALFGVFERHPNNDTLGTPGPLVHALESEANGEPELFASVSRVPSFYTLWMVNRLINGESQEEKRLPWLRLLREVANNPTVTEELRRQASDFLEFQDQ